MHSQSENQWTHNTDLVICTIEKANSLVNKIIEEKQYFDIEFFIIDEFHMLLDEGRGFLLETLISKLRTLEKIIKQDESSTKKSFQIIGMSATMSGLDKLQKWIDTEIYECKYRPVPLSEYILCSHKLMSTDHEKLLDLRSLKQQIKGDRDYAAILCAIYAKKRKAVLVFCPSKNQCEQLALKLQVQLPI